MHVSLFDIKCSHRTHTLLNIDIYFYSFVLFLLHYFTKKGIMVETKCKMLFKKYSVISQREALKR